MYNSSLGVIFGVEKYAEALKKIVKERDIQLNLLHELIEVKPDTKEAVFRILNQPEGTNKTFKVLSFIDPVSTFFLFNEGFCC